MMMSQIAILALGDVQQPNIGCTIAAGRDECQRRVIGRKGALIVESRIAREQFETGSVRMHAVNIGEPLVFGCQHHPFAVQGYVGRILHFAMRH